MSDDSPANYDDPYWYLRLDSPDWSLVAPTAYTVGYGSIDQVGTANGVSTTDQFNQVSELVVVAPTQSPLLPPPTDPMAGIYASLAQTDQIIANLAAQGGQSFAKSHIKVALNDPSLADSALVKYTVEHATELLSALYVAATTKLNAQVDGPGSYDPSGAQVFADLQRIHFVITDSTTFKDAQGVDRVNNQGAVTVWSKDQATITINPQILYDTGHITSFGGNGIDYTILHELGHALPDTLTYFAALEGTNTGPISASVIAHLEAFANTMGEGLAHFMGVTDYPTLDQIRNFTQSGTLDPATGAYTPSVISAPGSTAGLVLSAPAVYSVVSGSVNNDTITGSDAGDTLTGGGGSDTFVFAKEPWDITHVSDFVPGTDTIDLSWILKSAGYTGHDPVGDHYISFQSDGNGGTQILFDADGSGTPHDWSVEVDLDHTVVSSWEQLGAPAGATIALASPLVMLPEGASGSTPYSFSVIRTGGTSGASTANWAVSGSGTNQATAADFAGGVLPSGSVSFAAGEVTKTVIVNVAGDVAGEPSENFTVTLSGATGATLGPAIATGIIVDDDTALPSPQIALTTGYATLAEGNLDTSVLDFRVIRTGSATGTSSAHWAVTGSGASPVNAADFVGGVLPSGTVTFGAGETTKLISLNVAGDAIVEPDEGLSVSLSSVAGASLGVSTATGLIRNDDAVVATPEVTIYSPTLSLPEGSAGTTPFVFLLSRSGPTTSSSTVNWTVSGSGSTPADASDFQDAVLPSGTVTFAAGETTALVTVNVAGDGVVESDEGFTLALSGATGATLARAAATASIVNDDSASSPPRIVLTPGSLALAEGATGSTPFAFTLTRVGSTTGTSSAHWSVSGSGGNPAAAADFAGGVLPSGTVSFSPGDTTKTVTVNVAADSTIEQDEGFTLRLGNVVGASLDRATATGQIINDDAAAGTPKVALSNSTQTLPEGDSGTTAFSYTVIRTGSLTGSSSAHWSVSGSGTSPADASDFAGGILPSGTVSFAPYDSTATVTVNVAGDHAVELNEGFTLTLSGVAGASLGKATATGQINNDDTAPNDQIALTNNVSLPEGDVGSTGLSYTIIRTGTITSSASVNWSVVGSGAAPAGGNDFVGGILPSGTVTFASGETSKTITVNVAGDAVVEANEGFTLTLSNPVGATVGKGSVNGTISNDDNLAGQSLSGNDSSPSTLVGGGGNDTLSAKHLADTLTGGAGSDHFVLTVTPTNPGHVTDFTSGSDVIDLRPIFATTSYVGTNPVADGWLAFQSDGNGNTTVFVDPDGPSGPLAPTLMTTLMGVAPAWVQSGDFIFQ